MTATAERAPAPAPGEVYLPAELLAARVGEIAAATAAARSCSWPC
jgi:hypothetical protein